MGPIMAAPEVWLLATGERKRAILHRALTGPIGPDYPASYLRFHQHARLLGDAEAA
jgi:6-phosphogluconolactonase/glucosamine-6-phosphate isomerase/deaminase